MALSYVGAADYATYEGALPAFAVSDIAFVFAYRDGSNTAPSLPPAGWSSIAFSGADTNSSRLGYRVLQAGDTMTGAWANATEIQVLVLRGQHASPIGGSAAGGASSNQLSYTGFTLVDSGTPQGTSWVAGFAGHRSATNVNVKAVSGMTTRSGDVTPLGLHVDEDGVSGSFSTSSYTTTVDASSGWRSYAVEIRAAAAASSTATARLSLAGGQVPAVRTGHTLVARARKTSATPTGELLIQLYEGANARGSEFSTGLLTTSLADYSFDIDQTSAEAIGSYADLELRLRGYSSAGWTTAFEVARAYLIIPLAALGEVYGNTVSAFTASLSTAGYVGAGGAKATSTVRLSLAGGSAPVTRTDHKIVIRARKTNGAHVGELRVQLYEGATPRSTELASGELTTSLANYTLSIANADAASITSYADLEVRVRGVSSTGTSTVFEIAEARLETPEAGTAGEVTGQVVLSSIAAMSAGSGLLIYPGASVYPHNLISVKATSTVSVSSGAEVLGAVVLASSALVIPSGDTPPGTRTAIIDLPSVVAFGVSGLASVFGSVDVIGSSQVIVSAELNTISAIAALATTSSVVVSGYVGVNVTGAVLLASTATPHVRGQLGLGTPAEYPELRVELALDDSPLTYSPVWTSLSERVRSLATKRGRSYEFDRVETGTAGYILDNRDSALNPENTSSPYYPLVSTRPFRARLAFEGVTYPLFRGIAEGYPQGYPSSGHDALVSGTANDPFYSLNQARFLPGSTTLMSAITTIPSAQTEELLDVVSTALTMPQALPFVVRIGTEEMEVTEIVDGTRYRVLRGGDPDKPAEPHAVGSSVFTDVSSFTAELSGTRIRHVLEAVGFASEWFDLDPGQSLIAASGDLAGTNPLEHINLVADAEFGRFFAGRDGRYIFRDRHSIVEDYLNPVVTFVDAPSATGAVDEIPYALEGEIEHSEEKLFNRVRITIPDGTVTDMKDDASIAQHFERVFERDWPYASVVDAEAAARHVLARSLQHSLRLPALSVQGVRSGGDLWPLLLAREIGDRARFQHQPLGGGNPLDKEIIVDGISHARRGGSHVMRFECVEVDPNRYWILGLAGYSELGTTTRVGF